MKQAALVWALLISLLLTINLLIIVGSEIIRLIVSVILMIIIAPVVLALGDNAMVHLCIWGALTVAGTFLTVRASKRGEFSAATAWGALTILLIGVPITAFHSMLIWTEFS